MGPVMKIFVWWVFIYPVAVHEPCGHICASTNKSGTIYLPDNFPRSPQQHQQRCITTLSTPMTTQTNKHNAGSPNDQSVVWAGMFLLLIYYYFLMFFFFLLSSILLLTTHEWHQQEWCCQHQQRWHTTPTCPLTPSTEPYHHKWTNWKHTNDD